MKDDIAPPLNSVLATRLMLHALEGELYKQRGFNLLGGVTLIFPAKFRPSYFLFDRLNLKNLLGMFENYSKLPWAAVKMAQE